MNTLANAESINSEVIENVGLTEEPPQDTRTGGITPFSMSKPSNIWNLSSKGRYNFSGATEYNLLYTNYLFTGKKSVTLYIKNTSGTYDLDVSFKEKKLLSDTTVWGADIRIGKAVTIPLTLNSSSNYYLVANYPGKFEGYIE